MDMDQINQYRIGCEYLKSKFKLSTDVNERIEHILQECNDEELRMNYDREMIKYSNW